MLTIEEVLADRMTAIVDRQSISWVGAESLAKRSLGIITKEIEDV